MIFYTVWNKIQKATPRLCQLRETKLISWCCGYWTNSNTNSMTVKVLSHQSLHLTQTFIACKSHICTAPIQCDSGSLKTSCTKKKSLTHNSPKSLAGNKLLKPQARQIPSLSTGSTHAQKNTIPFADTASPHPSDKINVPPNREAIFCNASL